MTDPEAAAEAFGALADPTRVTILREFAAAMRERDHDSPGIVPELPFSEIYERVDVDSTSQLSYHLERLDGTYLRSTDDGWQFTTAGDAVVRLYLSDAYADDAAFDPVPVDEPCPYCGAESLRVAVEGLVLYRECDDCGERTGTMPVTPAQVHGRDAQSLLASAEARMVTYFWRFREGVCPECGSAADCWVRDVSAEPIPGESIGVAECEQCWRGLNGPLPIWLATHPATVAFHWDHGVDALSLSVGDLLDRRERGDWQTDRVGDEYAVTYRLDDERLRLRADEELSVLRTERIRRGPDREA
ncbi:hypothetical protein [Halosimplex sp. TS25]|uniref:DUF7351 domain-containing protein n=1 Tax=Halosimplex rarum TaxID=3396619 RepID=UPI0039E97703